MCGAGNSRLAWPWVGEVSYRVEFGGGAQVQFHSLPDQARNALIERAAELAVQPWDAVVRPPGDDARFREAVFGSGSGILGFYLDDDAQLFRIFDIVWIGQEPVDVEVLTLARLPAVPFAANCWSVDVHQLGRTPERSD
jgi:hypothetical protein